MSNTHAFIEGGEVAPRRHLHLTFPIPLERPLLIDCSVVDRQDLEAQACLDSEGWCVIIVTNVTDSPVSITPLEPVHLVITPRRSAAAAVPTKRPE